MWTRRAEPAQHRPFVTPEGAHQGAQGPHSDGSSAPELRKGPVLLCAQCVVHVCAHKGVSPTELFATPLNEEIRIRQTHSDSVSLRPEQLTAPSCPGGA